MRFSRGGYSGLNPVYAAPEPGRIPTTGAVTYDRGTTELKYADTYDIKELTVGGVTIGGTGGISGRISANTIVGSTGSNPRAISINGAVFANGGAITATSLKLNGIDDVKTAIEAKAAQTDVDNNKASISDLKNSKADATNVYTKTESDSNFARKIYEGKVDGLEATVGDASTGLDAANGKITALEGKTTGISYDSAAGTTVNDVTFNAGAVSGVKSINDKIKIFDDGTVTINENATNNPVTINSKGIKVGNNSAVVSEDGFKTSGDLYVGTKTNPTEDAIDARFYVKGADGSLKAADGKFTVNGTNGETVVTGTAGTTTITGGGVTISKAASSEYISISEGSIFATDSIKATKTISAGLETRMEDGKVVAKNGLYVGYSSTDITGATYDNSKFAVDGATGNTAVGGTLGVTGAANFAQETTFAGGIKTNTISENTPNAGVTVDEVVLKDGGITATGDVTTTGALKGKTLGIGIGNDKFTVNENGDTTVGGTLGVTGATTLGSTLAVNGNTTVGGTLGVTGKATLQDELQVNGKATFGDSAGSQTVINGGNITADGKLTSESALIGKVGITNTGIVTGISSLETDALTVKGELNIDGDITGKAINGDSLAINGNATVAGSLDVTGNVTGAKINGAAITETSFNGAQISTNKFNGVTLETNGNVTGGTITGTTVMDGAGASMNAGTVTGTTITDGNGFTATGGNVTAKNIKADTGNIAGVNFATGGGVSGISELTATTIKDGAGTIITGGKVEAKTAKIGAINIDNETIEGSSAYGLSIEGVKIKDGVVSDVNSLTANSATIGGVNTLDNKGLTVKTGSKVQVGTNTVIEDGSVKVSQKTSLTDQSLQLNDTNKWTREGGLLADKATVNGVVLGDAKGKATFTDDEGFTTIAGKNITTGKIIADELLIDRISLGKNGNNNISIDDSGNVTTKGEITITDATNAVMSKLSQDKATFGKDEANQTVIENGKLNAKAEDNTHQQAELKFDENGFAVSGQTAAGKTSAFGFNTKTGIGTFKGLDQTTTTVNGSVITSTNSATDTGVLNGSNLTLVNGANKTELTAGGVTFTGKKGASTKEFNTTTIDGGVITTDTLKVQRIQLGEKIVDERTGKEIGSGVTLASDGGFTAAGGNFKVTGGTTGSRGSITNVVGDDASGKTSFTTNQKGAKMSFKKGDVTSNVFVADGTANVSAGVGSIDVTNDSIINKVGDNASSTMTADSITDKVGGTVVETKDGSFKATGADGNGMAIDTNTGTTTFTGKDYKDATHKGTTVIDGNEITTGKITTDELVITGKGDAAGDGTGSLAFGGNGTIKSDVKEDGSTNNTQFTTDINGVNTMVTDGKITATTTENNVTAAGNRNTVTKGDDQKSEFKQELTSIGGVVTNGKINVAQYLDGKTGLLTNEVKDANGSSKLEQSSTGLTYTDSAKPDNATRINSSDVSIGSATSDKDRINLSDLGQIDELDKEIRDNEVYKKNETAVGGINAEAAIRREEVARLDGRINDVNDRVNKVGAMAAAIASLKSIGYDPQAPSEFSIGLGQYKGETGVAMGFFHYPNKNFMINVSLSTAGGETMGGIGATWRFGHKSPQKLLEEQREAQAKKELAAAEKYQAAAKLAKEAQERAEYAAKLARQAQVSADNAKAAADATQAKHFG